MSSGKRTEADMTVKTAVTIAQAAKAARRPDEPLGAAILRMLEEYDALPHAAVVVGKPGKVVRMKRSGGRGSAPPAAASAPAPARKLRQVFSSRAAGDHVFWTKLHELVQDYVTDKLLGQNESDLIEEVELLEGDLRVAFSVFSERVQRKSRKESFAVVASRPRLVEACRVLMVDPPKPSEGSESAFFAREQKSFRHLAREYHPDSRGGDHTRAAFQAVMDAHQVVEGYRAQLKKTGR